MVSIDSTDISGGTIDGEPIQEITIDGTVAWSAASSFVVSTLNGDTGKITLYEDTSGNGIADYEQTYTLTGGEQTLDISLFPQDASSTWWWSVEFTDDGNISDAGEVSKVEISY